MENGEELVSHPQLSLQWHQHHNTLVSLLDVLWERQELVDVTISAEGQSIQVHRIVLCACSKYFQDVLTMKGNTDKHTVIFLKDVSYEDLKALVDYMYKGEVRINEDQLNSFLHTAKSLGVRGLMGDSQKYNEDNRRKRRCSSIELSSEPDLSSMTATPPAPPPLRHKTSLSRTQSIDLVKNEPSNVESEINPMSDEQDSIQGMEDDLDLFQHCNVPINNQAGPSNNQDNAETGRQRVPCPQCNRTYSSVELVKRHLKYECGLEPQFQCPMCPRRTHHKHNLTAHLKTHFQIRRNRKPANDEELS